MLVASALVAALTSCGASSPPASATAKAAPPALPPLPPPPRDPHAIVEVAPTEFPDKDDGELTPPDRTLHLRARTAAREGRLVEAKQILGHLALAYPQHTVLVAQYNAVHAQMDAVRAKAKASLEATPLRRLDSPPAKYTLVQPAPLDDKRVPTLVKASEKTNAITDVEEWFKRNGIHSPEYFVPPASDLLFAPGTVSTTTVMNQLTGFTYTEYEPQARFDTTPLPLEVPLSYGTLSLTRAIASKPYLIAIYADRVVAVFDSRDHVKGLFDLESFVHPPADRTSRVVVGKATLTTPDRTQTADVTVGVHSLTLDLRFALAADGVLYVEHANRESGKQGQTAYVSAIDIDTASLAWRSAPLVANGNTFALVRGAVVSGYGFTAEPDFLFVLDRATGATKQKIPVRTGPDEIVWNDRSLFVRTYDTDLVFDVR